MAGKGDANRLTALRASVERALARFAPAKSADRAAKAPAMAAFRDPTIADLPSDSRGFDGGEDVAALSYSLTERLTDSADSLRRRNALLAEHARSLIEVTAARADGEKSLTIWGWRFIIGLAWLAIAFWLGQAGLNARAAGVAMTSAGVPLGDIAPLARIFQFAGAAAAGAAAIMAAGVFIAGNGTNDKLRRHGEAFGDALAGEARRLEEKLGLYRQKVVEGGGAGLDAASQAHLAALEASYFFENISFLTTVNADSADERYSDFLRRFGPVSAGYGAADMILIASLSLLLGLGMGMKLFGAAGAPGPTDKVALAITQYPWALNAIVIGGGVYLLLGVLTELLSGLIGAREMGKARKDALDSVRSAYLAQEAPLAADVIRQVADIVEILRGRLGGARATHAPEAHEAPEPEWRRRDLSVKLVETAFASAPQQWRTDAYAKKFASPQAPELPAKRGVERLKKPSSD